MGTLYPQRAQRAECSNIFATMLLGLRLFSPLVLFVGTSPIVYSRDMTAKPTRPVWRSLQSRGPQVGAVYSRTVNLPVIGVQTVVRTPPVPNPLAVCGHYLAVATTLLPFRHRGFGFSQRLRQSCNSWVSSN